MSLRTTGKRSRPTKAKPPPLVRNGVLACFGRGRMLGICGDRSGVPVMPKIIFGHRLAGVDGPEWELNNWGFLTPGECHHLNGGDAPFLLSGAHEIQASLLLKGDERLCPIPILCARDGPFLASVLSPCMPCTFAINLGVLTEVSPVLGSTGLVSGQGRR
jgi:hypothetical protein